MAKDAEKTRSLVGYTVSVADVGSTLPTDNTSALPVAFTEIGYISDGGFTRGRTGDVTELFDAAGAKVRTFRSKTARTFKFVALEDNDTRRALEEPGMTSSTSGGMTSRTVKDASPARKVVVLTLEDTTVNGDPYVDRIVIPVGEFVPGDAVRVDGEVEGVEFTVTTIKQSDGTHYYEYDGETVPVVPTITAVSPASGGAAGGTLVTITGGDFTGTTGATGVKFGGTNATSYNVINDSTISAVTPAHAAGAADVVVTNTTGPSTTRRRAFTYV